MTVAEAVKAAKAYVQELFADEGIRDVGLEEAVLEDDRQVWAITIGFETRIHAKAPESRAANILRQLYGDRRFKVVRLRDEDGAVISLTDRLIEQAGS